MQTQSLTATTIQQALIALRKGHLVAFPTETVYGLGADATNLQALKRLYEVKGRPKNHPVIVHIASIKQLPDWASFIPDKAYALANKFWPGPLTLILKRAHHVALELTGQQETIGLRIPNHPIALELLQKFEKGIAAPSANKFGSLSPTCAQDVISAFGKSVELVIDGGQCTVGIESTIVDCTNSTPRILRPGMILAEQIAQVIGDVTQPNFDESIDIRISGRLPSHYAPKTPLILVNTNQLQNTLSKLHESKKSVSVLSFTQCSQAGASKNIIASTNTIEYARMLYHYLRLLDSQNSDIILVENVPPDSAWVGISDRLNRAKTDLMR